MIKQVAAALQRHEMLCEKDSVTVALSGGADSVALLFALLANAKQLGYSLSALHVNHGLRGEESDGDEAFCQALCARLHLPFQSQRVDVLAFAQQKHLSTEEAARLLRYQMLEQHAVGKIATAHTLSDNIETILFNLTRGTGPQGLCGIPPVRGRLIRPLLDCTRQQVEAFLQQLGEGFVQDSTNADLAYSRNRLRHCVMPQLQAINPGLEQTVARCIALARQEEDYWQQQTAEALAGATAPHANGLCTAALKGLHPAVCSRVLVAWLRRAGLAYDQARVAALQQLVVAGGALQLGRGVRAVEKDGFLLLDFAEQRPNLPAKARFLPLTQQEIKFFVNNCTNEFKNCVDCDKIEQSISLRSRQTGDCIRLWGRGCTKSLKKLFNEAKIPPAQRESLLVAQSDGQPVWVEGFGVAEAFAITAETQNAIMITIDREEE